VPSFTAFLAGSIRLRQKPPSSSYLIPSPPDCECTHTQPQLLTPGAGAFAPPSSLPGNVLEFHVYQFQPPTSFTPSCYSNAVSHTSNTHTLPLPTGQPRFIIPIRLDTQRQFHTDDHTGRFGDWIGE
jgi:hypothetical protein